MDGQPLNPYELKKKHYFLAFKKLIIGNKGIPSFPVLLLPPATRAIFLYCES